MRLKNFPYWLQGLLLGVVVSLTFALILAFFLNVVPSIKQGGFDCATFTSEIGCDNIFDFLILTGIWVFWGIVFTVLPLAIIGAVIGFFFGKYKHRNI